MKGGPNFECENCELVNNAIKTVNTYYIFLVTSIKKKKSKINYCGLPKTLEINKNNDLVSYFNTICADVVPPFN